MFSSINVSNGYRYIKCNFCGSDDVELFTGEENGAGSADCEKKFDKLEAIYETLVKDMG